jgi:hypothetical protein
VRDGKTDSEDVPLGSPAHERPIAGIGLDLDTSEPASDTLRL